MSGYWAAMIALDASPDVGFDAAFIQQSPLSWIARNSSKPKRSSESEIWILHASSDWSETNLERSAAEVEAALFKEFWRALDTPPQSVRYSMAHRWLFALPTSPLDSRCLFNSDLQIGALRRLVRRTPRRRSVLERRSCSRPRARFDLRNEYRLARRIAEPAATFLTHGTMWAPAGAPAF